ncbi:MAG: signal peptidase I [Bacteroidia bacterium]
MIILRKIIKILFWAFIVWLFVRTFFFQTFLIPSSSMHGTLFEGDYVVINKLAYGARMPNTPLSIHVGGQKKFLDWIQLPYLRFFGYDNINRNDVIAFNYSLTDELPIDIREEYIKRCVAVAGDTLKIINGKVYVNSILDEPITIYKNYSVVSDQTIDTNTLQRLNILKNSSTENKKYNFFMSSAQADSLYKLSYIKSITVQPFSKEYYHPSVFPNYSFVKWNYDFFGPLYIPHEGDSILLDKNNLAVYQRIIERFEGAKITFKDENVFVNDKISAYYTFAQNYYFVIGDNRYNSIDSRNWGFIPESHIIGKAAFVLHSSQNSGRNFLKVK